MAHHFPSRSAKLTARVRQLMMWVAYAILALVASVALIFTDRELRGATALTVRTAHPEGIFIALAT